MKARFIGKVFAAAVAQPTSSLYTGVPNTDDFPQRSFEDFHTCSDSDPTTDSPPGQRTVPFSLFPVIAVPNANAKMERIDGAMIMRSLTQKIQESEWIGWL